MTRSRRAAGVLAGLLLAALPAAGRQPARSVEGWERAVLELPSEARAGEYRNAGYRLRRLGESLQVEVDLAPLHSEAPFTPPPGAGADAVERLARQLVRGSRNQYEAVSRVLGWVARNVRYELDREASQSPEAVLERGSGYCTGVARLAVAMLRGVGLEAREVAGFVVDELVDQADGWDGAVAAARGSSSGYHRWIEVRFADRGWVFSDPLRFHHFVPASYVRLASEELDLPPGAPAGSGRSLVYERRVEVVDVHAPAPSPILARRNSSRQTASTLRVVVEPAGAIEGVVHLEGRGSHWSQPLVAGEGTFFGLAAGEYQLVVETSAGERLSRRLRLAAPVRSVLGLSAAPVESSRPAQVAGRR